MAFSTFMSLVRGSTRCPSTSVRPAGSGRKRTAVVIGGGIHGITAALALAKTGVSVTVVDRNEGVLRGTSAATHNRAHLGYHYPRSISTARECLRGLGYFKTRYPHALHYPEEAYYVMENESQVTAEDYARFCNRLGIPYKLEWPSETLLARDRLDSSFRVPEPIFNLRVLSRLLEQDARAENVTIRTGWTAVGAAARDGRHTVIVEKAGDRIPLEADLVINATYAYANNTLYVCNLKSDRTQYCYHTTEVVLARSRDLRIPALTVMDGPFLSLMPLAGHNDLMLVYDVVYSVHRRQNGLVYEEPEEMESNWEKMVEHGRRYFPFMERLEFVRSLWGSRPVPVHDTRGARQTKIVAHPSSPGFYSILEGKFISAPLAAQDLVQLLRQEELI